MPEIKIGNYIPILAAVVLLSSFAMLPPNFVYAQTLDASTVNDLLNGFNPVIGPIPAKSFAAPSGCPIPPADNSDGAINKAQCGLYASDPLNNETKTRQDLEANPGYWTFGGSAAGFNPPAPLDFFKDAEGLHIGVQAPANGTYAGYYAVSPNTNGMLFHATITSPLRTTPSEYFQNGIYVQTTQDPINYIACVSVTNSAATLWVVGHTYSSPYQSLVFNPLYVDTSANQPLTRECTIITNGNNYLEVYLDNILVYSSNTLALAMPAPFNFFLEPQTSYNGQMLYGTYRDYYATTSKNIIIENTPQNSTTAEVVDSSGNVLAKSPVVLDSARIDVAKYHYPIDAYIKVYDSNMVQLASTPIAHTVYGGDLYYAVGPSTLDGTKQTITSVVDQANQTATSTIDTATQTVASTANTANQTATSTIDTATQTVASTANTANQTATSTIDTSTQTVASTANTANQTATSTINSGTHQLASMNVYSADLSGTKFPGMWVELWRSGVLLQQGYTPFSTYVQTGAQYEVYMGNWQNIMFDHWDDGSTDPRRTITPIQDVDLTAFFRTS
ncbi:MAG: hypothetical protein EPO62_03495 [Candidatus Nitrosotenuis sp.]|nr:MAG: hypothetical protein EPO62_03495 [Candidatus Nitrosotenuis sp.]